MLIYPSFIYLQNHKTGCTFVETCLREFCREPLLGYEKHAALVSRPDRFCFTNVREPMAQYRSLYAYGLLGKGEVFSRLTRSGRGDLYAGGASGFEKWLDFVIRPKNAGFLANKYTPEIARAVGFMSYRFLRLACPDFEGASPTLTGPSDVTEYFTRENVLGAVLRQESLAEGLAALVSGRLSNCFGSIPEVLEWLGQPRRINASGGEMEGGVVSPELIGRILRREAFLFNHFYQDTAADFARGIDG
jgi:hypothetical protein